MNKSEKKTKTRRMMPTLITGVIGLVFIIGIIPQITKNRVETEANNVLKMHDLKPIDKFGEYSYVYGQQDWVVEHVIDGRLDTVGVCLNKSQVDVDNMTIDKKKELPGKTFEIFGL